MSDDEIREKIKKYIHRDIDGFYYFLPDSCIYCSHVLRIIADMLDEMNKPWSEQIERELN